MSVQWRFGALIGALACSLAWVAAPQPAQACGGTFCDTGPQSMPVDQSGENILFIVDEQEVEVHIQIQYEGDPENFAWVIPLTAVPEFSIGSEQLFDNLLAGTVPNYGFTTSRDNCPMRGIGNGQGLDAAGDSGLTGAPGTTNAGGPEDGGGPTVVLRETVGAYEIAVLQGGTAAEVIDWLDVNGYQQDPEAEPIMEEYLAEGHLFGAIKLTGGAGVDQIHPVVLRYTSNEPCVPLRLTRIAAVEDMEVRTFFLGNGRMVPTNYRHVLVNPVMIDWLQTGANYKDVVIAAVDAEHANGRAFVTEYAGTSDVVAAAQLNDSQWRPDAYRTVDATGLASVLESQGLAFCSEWDACQLTHPLIGGLVSEFLTLPAGVTVEQYLDCPECAENEPTAWDPNGFADAFAERIVGPGRHAEQLLEQWPYVTRMYTTISPHEMTEDPIFHQRDDLPEVEAIRQGNRHTECDGDIVFRLPDGREVFIPAGGTWPEFPDEMPWEEEVAEMPMAGAPVLLADRSAQIDKLLAAYNASVGFGSGCEGCTVQGEDDDHWALGLMALALGAGLAGRRRRFSS